MTQKALEARKAYKREWAKKHPDKIKQYQQTYWNKKAAADDAGAEQAAQAEPQQAKQN